MDQINIESNSNIVKKSVIDEPDYRSRMRQVRYESIFWKIESYSP